MHRRLIYLFVFAGFFSLAIACGSKLVRKEEVQRISKEYEGVYAVKERIDVGNFDTLNKGARVRIFFKTAGDYVSVYAYPYSQPREEANGKNILQMFEGDFPNKKFSEELLKQRIAALVEEYKGKLDKPAPDKGFGTDLSKGKLPPPDGTKPSGRRR